MTRKSGVERVSRFFKSLRALLERGVKIVDLVRVFPLILKFGEDRLILLGFQDFRMPITDSVLGVRKKIAEVQIEIVDFLRSFSIKNNKALKVKLKT